MSCYLNVTKMKLKQNAMKKMWISHFEQKSGNQYTVWISGDGYDSYTDSSCNRYTVILWQFQEMAMIHTLIVAVIGILFYYFTYQGTSSRREELVTLNRTYDYIIGLYICIMKLFISNSLITLYFTPHWEYFSRFVPIVLSQYLFICLIMCLCGVQVKNGKHV